MPMIGHLAEAGVVIYNEFREGNIAPATQNLEFIQACEARLPKGHRIAHVRLDSAGYQADVFNDCEDTARPSPSADGWMPRPCRPLPRFPKPPGRGMPTAPSPKPCTA
jgi:hypothetical protein